MDFKESVRRHSLVVYFGLAYAITWLGLLAFAASKSFQLDNIAMGDILAMFFIMVSGPSISGVGMTAWLDGRAGLRDLGARLIRWRVNIRWYAVALLTVPALLLVILTLLSVTVSPVFKPGFVIMGLMIGLLAGMFEELGWSGFATPRLLKKYNPLTAGLVLGALWAAWHMMADYLGNSSAMGSGWLLNFVIYWFLALTAYRILMTWVYSHTDSVLIAILMHASYTGWSYVLSPTASFQENLVWRVLFVGGLWVLVGLVAFANRRRLPKPVPAH